MTNEEFKQRVLSLLERETANYKDYKVPELKTPELKMPDLKYNNKDLSNLKNKQEQEIRDQIELYKKARNTLGKTIDQVSYVLSQKKDYFSKDLKALEVVKEKIKK